MTHPTDASVRLPTQFISHGGGPWPFMQGEFAQGYERLSVALRALPRQLDATPKAILMVSAHWEEADFSVMTAPHPAMFYDYYGFPPETYEIRYPAPGLPALAERVRALADQAGIRVLSDANRGFDHGCFVPMAVMYPGADMPVVQLSLRQGLDPARHFALGRALKPLRDEGILIVGSGLSYHNLRNFGAEAAGPPSHAFDRWLQETLVESAPDIRREKLMHWSEAPAARLAHPREEHLIPLMVAAGAAEDEPAICDYHEDDFRGRVAVSNFRFGVPSPSTA